METQIILQGTTPEALVNLINKNVTAKLLELKNELLNKKTNDNLLTRKEVCKHSVIRKPPTEMQQLSRAYMLCLCGHGSRSH